MSKLRIITIAVLITSIIVGCQKEMAEPASEKQTSKTNEDTTSNPRLSYGDTLFFLKNQSGNYIVPVVTKPNSAGYFKAIPTGLVLDSVTGNINVTQSETGLRYKVFYLSTTGARLDSVKLVISGVDYKDAIVQIAQTQNVYDTAFPIYNARPEIALPCSDEDDDNDQLCIFDETDLNNDGNDDIPGVVQDKFLINIKTGTVDLEASFHAGVFGSSNPENGVTKDFQFYYRLQDASNMALNKITVRLYHYKTVNDIPQALLDTLSYRNYLSGQINSRTSNNGFNTNNNSPNPPNRFFSLSELAGPKRPPIIIIVSQ
jgi:hypothetical protein